MKSTLSHGLAQFIFFYSLLVYQAFPGKQAILAHNLLKDAYSVYKKKTKKKHSICETFKKKQKCFSI